MTVLQYVVHARARARSASFFFRPAVKKSRLECLSLFGHWLPTCGAAGGYKLALRRGLLRRECLQTAFLSSWWAVCPRPGCRYFLWRLPHRAVDQHHYAVLLDPIPVRLRQGTQIPIVCCNDNRHPPQKHAVRVCVCSCECAVVFCSVVLARAGCPWRFSCVCVCVSSAPPPAHLPTNTPLPPPPHPHTHTTRVSSTTGLHYFVFLSLWGSKDVNQLL